MLNGEPAASNGQLSAGAVPAPPLPPDLVAAHDATSAGGTVAVGDGPRPAETSSDAAPGKPPAVHVEDHFKRLGGLRDGLLVFGGAVYVVGRLVWAYQAQRFNLGIIPVEQSQYFMAGFVPMLIAVLVWFGVLGIKLFLEIIGRLYVPNASRRRRIVQRCVAVGYAVLGAVCLLLWVGEYCWTGRHYVPPNSLPYAASLLTITCVFMAGLPLLVRVRGNQATEKMQFDRFEWAMAALSPILVGALSVSLYGGLVYSWLPQEYGGALPRVAYLDLDRSKLSPDTLSGLLPPKELQSKNPIARTVLLDVFFTSKDTLLVKPYRKWHDNQTYEIQGGSVLGRTWADPARFRP